MIEERVDGSYRGVLEQRQQLLAEALVPDSRVAPMGTVITCWAGSQPGDAPSQTVPHLIGRPVGEGQ